MTSEHERVMRAPLCDQSRAQLITRGQRVKVGKTQMKLSNRAKSALATAGYSVSETSAIAQLAAFAAQNSGIDPRNYYDPNDRISGRKDAYYQGVRALKQEQRSIAEDWRRVKNALVIRGKYFITSEQPPHDARKYSVRSFDDKGDVDTVGDFCAYDSKADAMAAVPTN